MALTFPLPLEQFFHGLRIVTSDFSLSDVTINSRTRGGEQLTAEVGNSLWHGKADLTDYHHGQADAIRAKMSVLRRAGSSFFVRPSHRRGPVADPEGLVLGAAIPRIHSVAANNREMRISGLSAGYVISDGDYLSFTFGVSPLRYAFHQVVTGAAASGAGITPMIEVTPHIRPGWAAGAVVQLVNPIFKAVLVATPGYGTMRPMFTGGMGFDFVQAARG